MVATMNPPAALQRLGISKEAMRAIAWKNNIQARAAEPTPEVREYHSPRLINTSYLDGQQQRAKKAMLAANEAVIVGLVMQGLSVIEIALAFGVTDQAVRNRMKDFGVRPPAVSVRDSRLPVYRQIAKHEVLRIEIDDNHAKRKASSKKFDPRQLLFAWVN